MEVKETYSHLFRNYREVLRQFSSTLIDEKREAAFARFEKYGIPDARQEEYRYCDLTDSFSVDYGMNLYRMTVPTHPLNVFRCDVPTLSTKLFFVVNDAFYPNPQPTNLPEGVLCGSLNALLNEHPSVFAPYYDALSGESQDGTVALNTTFAQDGFVLYVPKGVNIDKPLQLIQMFQGEIDILATRRLLIIMEEGASASVVVCDHAITQAGRYLSNQVCEIFLGEGAQLDYYEMEMTHEKTTRVSNTFISQAADSSFRMCTIGLQNGKTRNNLHLAYQGRHAQSDLSGLSLLSAQQMADNHILLEHTVPECSSDQLFKYILDDSAHGVFGGKVKVWKDAQKTAAYQSNANLCTTDRVKMNTMPQLEIYADDVKCSHGAATGRIDENALFYMRARGVSDEDARMLLKLAFTASVVERIRLIPLQDRVKHLIDKRFRGELAKGIDCC